MLLAPGMLQRLAGTTRLWHQGLAAGTRALNRAASLPDQVKKGLEAVEATAQEEALASVLSQPASVPTLLAAGVLIPLHKLRTNSVHLAKCNTPD